MLNAVLVLFYLFTRPQSISQSIDQISLVLTKYTSEVCAKSQKRVDKRI